MGQIYDKGRYDYERNTLVQRASLAGCHRHDFGHTGRTGRRRSLGGQDWLDRVTVYQVVEDDHRAACVDVDRLRRGVGWG